MRRARTGRNFVLVSITLSAKNFGLKIFGRFFFGHQIFGRFKRYFSDEFRTFDLRWYKEKQLNEIKFMNLFFMNASHAWTLEKKNKLIQML